MSRNHKWTSANDELLHKEYGMGRYTDEGLACKIGVSRSAIVARATRIGLAHRRSARGKHAGVLRAAWADRLTKPPTGTGD